MLYFTSFKAGIQQQLEWFLSGKNLPIEIGHSVIRDLSDTGEISYEDLLRTVKSKLTNQDIILDNNVIYVNYGVDVSTPKVELATLVRIINLRYAGQFTIILNSEEVLFVPEDYIFTTSRNDMATELKSLVKVKRFGKKKVVESKVEEDAKVFEDVLDTSVIVAGEIKPTKQPSKGSGSTINTLDLGTNLAITGTGTTAAPAFLSDETANKPV